MPATKTATSVFSNVTTSQTSAAVDVSGAYAQQLFVDIVQVGTATTAASFQPQVSVDNTMYCSLPVFAAPLSPGTNDFVVDIPTGTKFIKVVYAQQAGGTSS